MHFYFLNFFRNCRERKILRFYWTNFKGVKFVGNFYSWCSRFFFFFQTRVDTFFWVRTINVRIINFVQYFLFVSSRQPIVSYVLCYVSQRCIHIKLCKNKITRGSNYLFRVHLSLLHPKSGPILSTRPDKSSLQELENGL